MNKPDSVESPRSKELADPVPGQIRTAKDGTSRSPIVASLHRFRQLDWADRLNLILAAILGCALVLSLSPLLLVAWICMQLGRHGLGFRRPGHLEADRRA
jgi:hypothetical protein